MSTFRGWGIWTGGSIVFDREETMDKIETLKQWISESSRIVFFGGAGVSTEL